MELHGDKVVLRPVTDGDTGWSLSSERSCSAVLTSDWLSAL